MESELHHLHSNKVLVLQAADGPSGHPACPAMGHLLRHPLLYPHLGDGALREELPNRDPHFQSNLLHLCAHLLRPTVRSHREVLQQCAGHNHQGGVGTGRRKRVRGIGWDGGMETNVRCREINHMINLYNKEGEMEGCTVFRWPLGKTLLSVSFFNELCLLSALDSVGRRGRVLKILIFCHLLEFINVGIPFQPDF